MRKIDKATYDLQPDNYELRSGNEAEAPACPYGNRYAWVGFDKANQEYVRFSKRLFKSLIQHINETTIENETKKTDHL